MADFEFLPPEAVTFTIRASVALPTFKFSFRLPAPDFSVFDSKEPIE